MNKKVYIVTSGEYSDYRINAVFSSRKLAKKYIELQARVGFWNFTTPRIEEYTLDELPTYPLNKNHYLVILELEIGNLLDIDLTNINSDKVLNFTVVNRSDKANEIWVYCWAKDEEHAKKIAYDVRTKVLAEKENL